MHSVHTCTERAHTHRTCAQTHIRIPHIHTNANTARKVTELAFLLARGPEDGVERERYHAKYGFAAYKKFCLFLPALPLGVETFFFRVCMFLEIRR